MSKFADSVARVQVQVDAPGRMIILGLDRQPLKDKDGGTNYIDLYSVDGERARKHDRAIRNRRLAMRGRGKLTASELDGDHLELLVALTAGWGAIGKDGVAVPEAEFSAEAARTLYSDPANAEIRTQVEEFIADRENFLKASQKT